MTERQMVPPSHRRPECADEHDSSRVEREQKGEGNSLELNVSLDIERRFTEVNMMRKGQVKRLDRNDATGQAMFVESLFQIAA